MSEFISEIIFRTDDEITATTLSMALKGIGLGAGCTGEDKKVRWAVLNETIYYKAYVMTKVIDKVSEYYSRPEEGNTLKKYAFSELEKVCNDGDPEKIYWLNYQKMQDRIAEYSLSGDEESLKEKFTDHIRIVISNSSFKDETNFIVQSAERFARYDKMMIYLQDSVATAQHTGVVKSMGTPPNWIFPAFWVVVIFLLVWFIFR